MTVPALPCPRLSVSATTRSSVPAVPRRRPGQARGVGGCGLALALWIGWIAGWGGGLAAWAAESVPPLPSGPPYPTRPAPPRPEVGPVPTPRPVVNRMLQMAEIKADDVVYDLGCGDGRIVVAAAKRFGVKAVGVDIDPQCVLDARANVRTNGLEHLVTIKQADVFTLDFGDATVVMLYLLPELNVRLMPQLARLKPGTRILSHDFDMRGAVPVQVYRMAAVDDPLRALPSSVPADDVILPPMPPPMSRMHTIYKWVVPWQIGETPPLQRSAPPAAEPAP